MISVNGSGYIWFWIWTSDFTMQFLVSQKFEMIKEQQESRPDFRDVAVISSRLVTRCRQPTTVVFFNQESLTLSVLDTVDVVVRLPYFSKSDLSLIYYSLNHITMSNLGHA